MADLSDGTFEALRGARVLLTGDTGFKGSWLAAWLVELGCEVAGFALPPEGDEPLFDRLGLSAKIAHSDGDLREAAPISRLVGEFRPDVVFHLAAQSLVLRGYAEPKATFDTNVGGSVNLLEAIRATESTRALVYVTSDKVYAERNSKAGYAEADPLGGSDPYSASKAAADIAFGAYSAAFFQKRRHFGAASVRAGNVIGGGDWAENRLVPDCIRALGAARPIGLRNPNAVRPWQHVLEPLAGYLMLAAGLLERPHAFDGAWNFGPEPDDMRPVCSIADIVIDAWGEGCVEAAPVVEPHHEASALYLASDKAKRELGWRPRWDVATAVRKTVEWYREVAGGGNAAAVTHRQIEEYMES